MSDMDFNKGILSGLKISKKIMDNSATNFELECTIKGAIFVMEQYVMEDEKVENE